MAENETGKTTGLPMKDGPNGGKLLKTYKGMTGLNPNGRPRGSLNSKTIIRRWLQAMNNNAVNELTGIEEKLSNLDVAIIKQVVKAKDGDTLALKELLDRMEGRSKQISEITGKDGNPIQQEVQDVVEFHDYSGKVKK